MSYLSFLNQILVSSAHQKQYNTSTIRISASLNSFKSPIVAFGKFNVTSLKNHAEK